MEETIRKQVRFTLEIKLRKYIFSQNMTIFSVANVFFLNPRYNGKVRTHVTNIELKKRI